MSVPFWWHGSREVEGRILHNGTLCQVDTGQRVIGVTAHHVYSKFLEDRSSDRTLICQFGNLTVDPESLCIDSDERLDLVTFDLSTIIGSRARFVAKRWPPSHPHVGDLVIYGGVAGTPRSIDLQTDTATFSFESITGLVTDVGRRGILIEVNYSKLYDADATGRELVASDPCGTSGGPVYRIEDSHEPFGLELVGFIQEQATDHNFMLARHADFIRQDGSIQP